MMFSRIVPDADVLRGKPRIRGTRITVEFILELIASTTRTAGCRN